MTIRQVFLTVVCALVGASAASAQDPTSFVIGTYHQCDQNRENRADEIYEETLAPLLQKHVDSGALSSIGWGRHWMGGDWRRLEYIIGTDLDAMVDARDAYFEQLLEEHAAAAEELTDICPGHDDYIWASAATSQSPDAVGQNRGSVGVSTYFECSDEEFEADEILNAVYAPVLNAHVEAGRISSWNWLRHVMGGKYRRVLVFDGASHKAVINYWNELSVALEEASPELSRRFTEICHSHSDYVWDMGAN